MESTITERAWEAKCAEVASLKAEVASARALLREEEARGDAWKLLAEKELGNAKSAEAKLAEEREQWNQACMKWTAELEKHGKAHPAKTASQRAVDNGICGFCFGDPNEFLDRCSSCGGTGKHTPIPVSSKVILHLPQDADIDEDCR